MIKKLIIVVLCLTMILTVFGCKTDEDTSGTTAATTTKATTTKAATTTTTQATTEKEPEDIYLLVRREAGTEMPDDEKVGEYILEQTGIRVNIIKPPAGAYDERLSIMLATGEPLDSFVVAPSYYDYQQKGMLMVLNDLLDQFGPNIKDGISKDQFDAVSNSDTGEIYLIPFGGATMLGNAPRIRKDWLDELGLEIPETLEEFESVLEAFKNTDKFGSNIIPLATHWSFGQLERPMAGLFTEYGNHNWIDETDGKVKPAVLAPGYKEFIEKLAEWYSKGYIWKDFLIQEFTAINDLVAQNRVAVMITWSSVGLGGYQTLLEEGIDCEYAYMTKWEGPAGSGYSRLPLGPEGIGISSKAQNAEGTIKYYNWMADDVQNNNVVLYGLEGEHWKWENKEDKLISMIEPEGRYSGAYSAAWQGSPKTQVALDNLSGRLWQNIAEFQLLPLDLKVGEDHGTVYNEVAITESVAAFGDIEKLKDQWIAKFIMGQEQFSKWDDFIEQLMDIGLDKVIEERTRQYNEFHGK